MGSKRLSFALWRKLDSHNISSFQRLAQHFDLRILSINYRKESNILFNSSRNALDLRVESLPLISLVSRVLLAIFDARKFRPLVLFHHGYHRPFFVLLAIVNSISGGVNILCFDICYVNKLSQICGVFAFRSFLNRFYDLAYVAGIKSSEYAFKLGFEQSRVYGGLFDVHADIQGKCRFNSELSSSSSKNRGIKFLFVGRLVKSKGFDLLLDAWSDLVRNKVFAANQLIICGAGPLDDPSLSDLCDFRGYVTPKMLGDIYLDADCLVSPSRYDPFGACLLEAASLGLPIISSECVGAAHDFVDHMVNGYIIEKLDIENIKVALNFVNGSFLDGSLSGMKKVSLLKYKKYSESSDLFIDHLLSLL